MSLMPIEQVIEKDPHVDPVDVTRLMFWVATEPLRQRPKPKDIKRGIEALIDEGPLVGLAAAIFLLATAPIGGIAEGVARAHRAIEETKLKEE